LPILQDGRLVGRADLRNDRATRTLEARRIGLEPTAERTASAAGVGEALRSLARFVGAESVRIGEATPARFRRELLKNTS
ncbi:MAG: DNA glycosylase AlkZ-like family protein, partial [Candidatus Binatia bacterium]